MTIKNDLMETYLKFVKLEAGKRGKRKRKYTLRKQLRNRIKGFSFLETSVKTNAIT